MTAAQFRAVRAMLEHRRVGPRSQSLGHPVTQEDVRRRWWRWLAAYTAVSAAFWFLALVLGDGGNTSVELTSQGAVLNGLGIVWLANGSQIPRVLLGAEAFIVCAGLLADGLPPFGPVFNLLALVAGAQLALLVCRWAPAPRESPGRPPDPAEFFLRDDDRSGIAGGPCGVGRQ